MNRKFTNIFNWTFDNILPSFIRDSKLFYWTCYTAIFGNKAKYFAEFKQKAPFMNEAEFCKYYEFLSDKHIQRETDLNEKSIHLILKEIEGESALDIACGKGYLVDRIVEQLKIKVIGMDMILPNTINMNELATFKVGNIERIDLESESVDTVICTHTLEHVQNIELAISELRRVAKKKLIVVLPCQREYKYTFDLHLHFFPYEHSIQRVFRNEKATITKVGNDFVYVETYTDSPKD